MTVFEKKYQKANRNNGNLNEEELLSKSTHCQDIVARSSVASPSYCRGDPVVFWLTLTCFPSQANGEFIVFLQPKIPPDLLFIHLQ